MLRVTFSSTTPRHNRTNRLRLVPIPTVRRGRAVPLIRRGSAVGATCDALITQLVHRCIGFAFDLADEKQIRRYRHGVSLLTAFVFKCLVGSSFLPQRRRRSGHGGQGRAEFF